MAGSLNKVQLIGHLGRDPEVKTLNSGDKVANMRIATSESWKDKNSGERQERTEWHNVVIWGKLAEVAGQYLKKGSKVFVEGQLQTRKWQDQGGNDRYSTEVVLRGFSAQLIMLDGKGDGGGERRRDDSGYGDEENRRPTSSIRTYAEELDDEIPF